MATTALALSPFHVFSASWYGVYRSIEGASGNKLSQIIGSKVLALVAEDGKSSPRSGVFALYIT